MTALLLTAFALAAVCLWALVRVGKKPKPRPSLRLGAHIRDTTEGRR